MQNLTDTELLTEINLIIPLVEACEPSPDTRRILLELDLGRRRLLGEQINSRAEQLEERGVLLSKVAGCAKIADRVIVAGHELVDREYRAEFNLDELPRRIANVESSNTFYSLYHDLRHWAQSELFEVLFPIAADCRSYPWPAYDVAGELLIGLDPRCPLTCEEVLLRLDGAYLEASTKAVPFYLVTQFGKYNVLQEARRLMADLEVSESARQNIGIVRYWSSMPPSHLVRHSRMG
jgi:hypothetical protein